MYSYCLASAYSIQYDTHIGNCLFRIYHRLGKPQEGLPYIESALQHAETAEIPADSLIRYKDTLAWLYIDLGRYAEAKALANIDFGAMAFGI